MQTKKKLRSKSPMRKQESQISETESDPHAIVKFVARIRKPLEIDLNTETQKKPHERSRSPISTRSTIVCPQQQNNNKSDSQLQPNTKYSIFSTKEQSNIVISSDVPISGKLINSTLIQTSDIPFFKSSLKNKTSVFTFDSAASECISQEKFYNQNVRNLVQDLLHGHSATIICFGPAEYLNKFFIIF